MRAYLALANVTLVETSEGPLLFDTGHFGVVFRKDG
jgi:hypothetical protein